MSRRLLFSWCIVLSFVVLGTSFAQDYSAMWNNAKRAKLGLDASPARPIQSEGQATMNPLSPPNTPDIQVFNPSNFWQSENSIGINYSNPNQLMVSTNGQIPGSNPVVQQPWAFSTDGGVTWPASMQSESIPPGIVDCFGDPVAYFDVSGRAYYSTLGSPSGIYFVTTTNFGATWSARSNADNLNSTGDDKQHATADFSGTFPNNVYTAWTDFNVTGTPIQFARSTNQGTSWLPRVALPIGSNRGQGVHIATGPNGEVYVMWAHYTTGTAEVGIGWAKSTDGGATFTTPAIAFPINGVRISNGGIAAINNVRTASFPYHDVDRSNGARRGWVYVVVPELDVANTGQADIYFYRSTNGGTTWSSRMKVNGPDVQAGKWQFMPSIAVDPTTGGISISYYSMDSTGSNFMTNRYMAYSVDGGDTWDNFVISDVRALWAPQGTPSTNTTYNGDYYETVAMNGKAWATWTDRRLGASGTFNRAYVGIVTYAENFGWVRGTVSNLSGGTPLQGVAIDFVQNVLQQGATTAANGSYLAGAQVDTPGTTANLTLRGRKFGFVDTTVAVTLTRFDTLTRNFSMRPAPSGTLSVHSRHPGGNLRSYVEVKFGALVVASDSTNATTGLFSTTLPTGTYSVKVDAPPPYRTLNFPSVAITQGATTNVDALTRAVFEFTPTAVRDTLPVGGSRVKNLTIANTTPDTVQYRITDDNALRIQTRTIDYSLPSVKRSMELQNTSVTPKGQADPISPVTDSPDGRGGPDAFGYQWVDSDEPDGPVFDWFDISTIGTQITVMTSGTLDDGFATIPFPASFPLYGNTYSSINVGTNGFVNFGTGSTSLSNGAIPSVAAPNNAIYGFWDDLDFRTSGKLLYYHDVATGRFIVQYDKAPRFGSASVDTLTFQIIMKPSGEVLIQFLRVVGTVLNSGTIGVENSSGTVALQVVNNAAYVHNNLAIRIYLPDAPWISENPSFGAIPPNSNQIIQCAFNATGLLAGTLYNANIFVEATHPDVAVPFVVPASLKVNAADSAVMNLSKTSITYPATQVNTSRADSLYARNGGALPLVISSITSNSARYVVTPASANVSPGDSVKIRVTYTPIAVGTDTGRVIILSNSQGTPRRDVMLSGSGIGAPSIVVSVTTIADTLQVGQTNTKQFTITNSTAPPVSPLYVSITDSGAWVNVTPALDTLAGSQTKNYATAFNATGLTVGTYTTNIRIASNDPANPLKIVVATLRVIGGPVISVRPDSVVRTLAAGASGTDTLTIRNTGVSALNWSMSEAPGEPADMSNAIKKYHAALPPVPKGVDFPMTDSPDTSGGPDAFGYRWIDSDSPGGPTFSWIDISTTGASLDSASDWVPTGTNRKGDEGYFAVRMPFSFNYYGVAYDTLFIGTNGNVMFQRPTADIFTNAIFPTAGGPIDNHIGVFWDDLEVRAGARVYYGASAGKFVVQYQGMARFAGTVPNYTFQVILSPTGEILTQYLAMSISGGVLNSASIGIENANGTVGLGVLFNAAPPGYMHNNLAILFSRGVSWLEESPTSGAINPGDSAKVVLTYNTTGLTAGLYRAILSITSNDFSNNPKNVPVRLTVTGGATSITVTSPNGGEQWNIGQAYSVTWNQNGVDSVTISYSTTGRTGTYTTIASVPARPDMWKHPKSFARPMAGGEFDDPLGTFAWTIPNTPSTNCFVRIVRKSTGTPGDTSDAAFTIQTAPVPGDTSWVVQPSGSTSTFYAVKAINNNVAWVAGIGGVVLRTTNAGANWTPVGGGAIGTADIYSIEALDANTAFVTTSPSATFIYRTTNGGASWTQVYTLAGGFINGMIMVSPTTGFAVGDPVGGKWTVLATTDGGATWARMPTEPNQVGTEAGWNNSFVIAGNNAWFGTNSTKVYRTTDVGLTWTSSATTTLNSYGLHFNDVTNGALVGSAGATNYSTNGGTSWAAGGAAGTGQGSGVSGVNGSEFWATVGTSVYYTTNGGVTWSNAAKNGYPGTAALWALDITSAAGGTYGWAAGATGTIVRYRRTVTEVANGPAAVPTVYALDQNFPNPFNPSTTIRFSLPEQATVSLKIFNMLGQEVATLAEGDRSAAFHEVVWNGRNSTGAQVASGMYFYRIEATGVSGANFTNMKKLILLK